MELRQAACIVCAIWIAVQLIGLAIAGLYSRYSAVIAEYHVAIACLYSCLYIRRGLYDLGNLADYLVALLMRRILFYIIVIHLVHALHVGIPIRLMLKINSGSPYGVTLGGSYNSLVNSNIGSFYSEAERAGVGILRYGSFKLNAGNAYRGSCFHRAVHGHSRGCIRTLNAVINR